MYDNSKKSLSLILATALFLILLPSTSAAQTLGCSAVPSSWAAVQQGLDLLALGACSSHDRCYRSCNPAGGPYHGFGYKATCDAAFYGNLLAACGAWSVILSYPNAEWVDSGEFLEDCGEFATVALAGVTVLGTTPFLSQQCMHCNQWACDQRGWAFNQNLCEANCGDYGSRDDCDDLPPPPGCTFCPIGLDIQGNGFKLSGPNPAVYFDLNADGTLDHTSWTRKQTKDAFLVLDRNQNGIIDDGRELFGDSTPMLLSAQVAANGYEVLAEFDQAALGGNEDGMISAEDRIFPQLQLWFDKNRDGATQSGELESLSENEVAAISLDFTSDGHVDQWGNHFKWQSPIYFEDGSSSMSKDVFFARIFND